MHIIVILLFDHDNHKNKYQQFSNYMLVYHTCMKVITLLNIRLTGGDHHFESFVEICLNKMWGLISQSGWNDNNAKVVCIQLGYSGNG